MRTSSTHPPALSDTGPQQLVPSFGARNGFEIAATTTSNGSTTPHGATGGGPPRRKPCLASGSAPHFRADQRRAPSRSAGELAVLMNSKFPLALAEGSSAPRSPPPAFVGTRSGVECHSPGARFYLGRTLETAGPLRAGQDRGLGVRPPRRLRAVRTRTASPIKVRCRIICSSHVLPGCLYRPPRDRCYRRYLITCLSYPSSFLTCVPLAACAG